MTIAINRDSASASPQRNRAFPAELVSGGPVDTTLPQLFDPDAGVTVMAPLGEGKGWWVGAPSAYWDGSRFYLSFRTRKPQPERGGLFQVAVSDDGEHFEPVCTVRKEDLGTSSIERGALLQAGPDLWRLYLSYVDPADNRWRIDLLEAPSPDQFDASQRRPILTAADIQAEGIKDPWVCQVGDTWYMIVSYAPTPEGAVDYEAMHGTRDIYNTGTSKSLSGLATSADGLSWEWQGTILEPSESGWDQYAARLNTVFHDGSRFVGLYDGSRSVEENYEERCGVAVSNDLRSWQRLSVDGPVVGSAGPNEPGAVRYAEAVQGPDWIRFYYEYTRPDGSHELRTVLVNR
jgi:hypothetical protein